MKWNTTLSCARAVLLLVGVATGSLAIANPLPAVNSDANPEQDFENRRNASGVFFSNGFDSWNETHDGFQVRTGDFRVHEVDGPKSVPNNCVNGYCYAAHDPGMAASGGGSLRLTANDVARADHGGAWYYGNAATNCTDGAPGTANSSHCKEWPTTIGEGEKLTMSYRVRQNSAMTNFDWNSTGGESLKFHILWRSGSSCSDMQNVLTIGKSTRTLNVYSNCAGNLMRYGFVNAPCNACANTFDYPPYGPPINTGSNNSSYWSKQSQAGPPNGYKYASSYTSESKYDALEPYAGGRANAWWWVYIEIDVGKRKSVATCNKWGDSDCSHVRAWVSFGDGDTLKQFKDFRWPWQINQSGQSFQNLMLTVYQTSKDFSNNSGNEYRWYDELILSTAPQHAPANLSLPSGGGGSVVDAVPPEPPSQFRIELQ